MTATILVAIRAKMEGHNYNLALINVRLNEVGSEW